MKHFLLTIFAVMLCKGLSAQIIADSSFEASGAGGTAWTSTSAAFGTSFCDAGSCGTCGGPCVPRTGAWYVWFGGTALAEIGTAVQNFNTVSSGTGTLKFYLKVPMKGTAGDTLAVLLDGVAKQKIATIDSVGAYTAISVNTGSMAAGAHNLTFRFEKLEGETAVNVLVDDVTLTMGGTVGMEEIDFSNGIQISSNIEDKRIMVAYNFKEIQNLRIAATDISGKNVYDSTLGNQTAGESQIGTEGWSAGVYNVTLTSDKGLAKTTKVVIF